MKPHVGNRGSRKLNAPLTNRLRHNCFEKLTSNVYLSSVPEESIFIDERWRVLENIVSCNFVPDWKDDVALLYDFSVEHGIEFLLRPTGIREKVRGEDENTFVAFTKAAFNTFA